MNRKAWMQAMFAAALSLETSSCTDDTPNDVRGLGAGGAAAGSPPITNAGGTMVASGGASVGSGGLAKPPGTGGATLASGGANAAMGGTGSAAAGGSTSAGAGGAAGAMLTGGASGTGPAGGAGQGGAATAGACDRACLIGVLSSYLDALAARSPMNVPVDSTLKYTDNGVTAQLGDGLWKTASQLVADERMDFADPMTGQVASQVVVNENGTTPVIYQVRLKVVNRKITEIESMTVRRTGAANGFFTPQNMKPEAVFLQTIDPAKRMTRDQMKTEVDLYIDYLDGKTKAAGVHFDSMCKRYENGVATATGLASFQAQSWMFSVTPRYLVFDEEMGLVWGMFPFTQAATSLVVGELFKVMDSKIMMIQAVMASIPTTAWK
jgi:hypothetical protein